LIFGKTAEKSGDPLESIMASYSRPKMTLLARDWDAVRDLTVAVSNAYHYDGINFPPAVLAKLKAAEAVLA
jgi:hypothetical protein